MYSQLVELLIFNGIESVPFLLMLQKDFSVLKLKSWLDWLVISLILYITPIIITVPLLSQFIMVVWISIYSSKQSEMSLKETILLGFSVLGIAFAVQFICSMMVMYLFGISSLIGFDVTLYRLITLIISVIIEVFIIRYLVIKIKEFSK